MQHHIIMDGVRVGFFTEERHRDEAFDDLIRVREEEGGITHSLLKSNESQWGREQNEQYDSGINA